MKMQRWFERAILVAAAMLAGAAPMLFAQGQQLFEWSGRVDREVQISMRGNRVSTRSMDNNSFDARERSRVFSSMPRQDGQVIAQVSSGRGRVDVIQQPSSQNGYTTVVRIQDPGSGSENYRVTAYWQPYANGEYGGRNRGHEVYGGRGPGNGQNGGLGQVGQGSQNGNRSMMHWSGNVDGQLEIRLQNGRASYRTLSGAQPTSRSDEHGQHEHGARQRSEHRAESGARFDQRHSTAVVIERLRDRDSHQRSSGWGGLLRLRPTLAIRPDNKRAQTRRATIRL